MTFALHFLVIWLGAQTLCASLPQAANGRFTASTLARSGTGVGPTADADLRRSAAESRAVDRGSFLRPLQLQDHFHTVAACYPSAAALSDRIAQEDRDAEMPAKTDSIAMMATE